MRKILSIDGGGIRGTFPAAFLAELEKDLERPIHEHFDLIAGTSTGGIIALGLALGHSASEILNLYEREGPRIFSQTQKGFKGLLTDTILKAKHFSWGPKHSHKKLEAALVDVFGESKLGDAATRLFIPAYHRQTGQVYIFKTAHHERLKSDYKVLARDVAMSTAAAPTFFKEHVTESGIGLIDGGVWANNPVGFVVAEGVANLGWHPSEIQVLSIGCLDNVLNLKNAYSAAGIQLDLADIFMSGQSSSSLGLAHTLTGDVGGSGHKAIYRITQSVPSGYFSLDNTSKIGELRDRAQAEARKERPYIESVFFKETVEPFNPVYKLE